MPAGPLSAVSTIVLNLQNIQNWFNFFYSVCCQMSDWAQNERRFSASALWPRSYVHDLYQRNSAGTNMFNERPGDLHSSRKVDQKRGRLLSNHWFPNTGRRGCCRHFNSTGWVTLPVCMLKYSCGNILNPELPLIQPSEGECVEMLG